MQLNKKILNVTLRGFTLGGKFLLIFVLAKLLDPVDVGVYGLFAAFVFYFLMAIGFEFHTYVTRELISADSRQWAAMLRDQGLVYCFAYIVVLPFCLYAFYSSLLPWRVIYLFFPILALEHVAQELNRILIALSEQVYASLVLFVRAGLWAIIAALWMWLSPEVRTLEFVFGSWLVGVLFACLVGFVRLGKIDFGSLKQPVNWIWIKRGVVSCMPFLIATLSLRGMYLVDRIFIETWIGAEALAAYVLFFSIGNAIMSFIDAAVFSFSFPSLVYAYQSGNVEKFNNEMRHLGIKTLLFVTALSLLAVLFSGALVVWIGREVYLNYQSMIYFVLVANFIFVINMVPHYGLYAMKIDRPILYLHLLSLPVFVVAAILLNPYLKAAAVPAAMGLAFLFLMCGKYYEYRKCIRAVTLNS